VSRHSLVPLLVAAAALSGCGGGSRTADKAGGTANKAVVLTLATTASAGLADAPPVREFAHRVAVVSHGALRIDVTAQWGNLAPDAEARLVRAVGAGTVDLGFVGSRVFDLLGVSSFSPLSAPMLIDSYRLEAAVMRSDLPPLMTASLKPLHVAGVGMFGDAIRRPFSVRRALLDPRSWRGISFGTYPSRVQEATIRVLGARPFHAFGNYRQHALQLGLIQGFEYDVGRYAQYSIEPLAPYVTSNVEMWPQVDVVLANPQWLRSLSAQQRRWLREASAGTADTSVALVSHEAGAVRRACAQGARFVDATAAQLAGLRRAFAVVYAKLGRDPSTSLYLRRIQRLKRSLAARPSTASPLPAGCRR
jgi:TRAP-type transport system periplasmic protein